jgi:hypothetical protein
MFVQVIRGGVKDAGALHAASDKWQSELRPGAKGFLGVTGGVADDGRAITIVRFGSEEAAKANSERPEQGAWWNETSKLYEGDIAFYNCPTVHLAMGGGSDDAGFVQTMVYKPKDVDAVIALSDEFEKVASMRPDLLGGVLAVATDGTVFDTNYFTSEAEARKNEGAPMTPEVQELFGRMQELTGDVEFIDLRDPWLD